MRARIIYNPVSGKEIIKKNLVEILKILENAGYETSAFETTPRPNSAKDEATRAAKAGFDIIVAAGGDGTINEVVNGIAPLEHRPTLGIIPSGTTNDYARALKIPRGGNILDAAKVIADGKTIKMDIGLAKNKQKEQYFINIGAGGYLTELTYDVPTKLKSVLGYLAYLVKGAEMLPRLKPVHMQLEYDSGIYDGEASMFFLALTNSVGGFETIVPDAQLDDGKFSLIIVKTSNILEILHLITLMLNGGKHITDDRIIYLKTSKFKAALKDEDAKLMINLDGEYGGDAPMEFINLKQHISFLANTDDISETAMYKEEQTEFIQEVESLTDADLNGDGLIGNGKQENE